MSELKHWGISTDMYVRVPEHEVLISFNNDTDAYAFHGWWEKEGKASFEKFFEEHGEEYEYF